MSSTSPSKFSSEGFDLDSFPGTESESGKQDDVVFEIGGGVSTPNDDKRQQEEPPQAQTFDPTSKSEKLKAEGNDQFKLGNYLEAYDYYTDAIEACPGMTGAEILKLRDEFEEKEREKAYERHRRAEEERRLARQQQSVGDQEAESQQAVSREEEADKPAVFTAPPHEFGSKLSVYHCNRAACLLHLGRYGEAITDCDVSILLNPTYAKALIRRMTAYEKTDQTEEALRDAKRALECDPTNANARRNVTRLQKIEDERLEKLKEETMGKLKDLGNSILGNFGLSLDNFKAEKDPKSGSYSISFNQNSSGGGSS